MALCARLPVPCSEGNYLESLKKQRPYPPSLPPTSREKYLRGLSLRRRRFICSPVRDVHPVLEFGFGSTVSTQDDAVVSPISVLSRILTSDRGHLVNI